MMALALFNIGGITKNNQTHTNNSTKKEEYRWSTWGRYKSKQTHKKNWWIIISLPERAVGYSYQLGVDCCVVMAVFHKHFNEAGDFLIPCCTENSLKSCMRILTLDWTFPYSLQMNPIELHCLNTFISSVGSLQNKKFHLINMFRLHT